jgi:pimeloyl-ACP methyl ester carboxylesterase
LETGKAETSAGIRFFVLKNKQLFKSVAIVMAVIMVVYTGLSIFGAWKTMDIPRLPLTDSPASRGLIYRDISFKSRDDGVLLKGWYLPGSGDSVLLIVNGGYQNRVDENADTLGLAAGMVGKGYNVMLFDLRGRGESEGEGQALSNIEKDIGGAVDYIKGRGYGPENIYLMGFCSGAASSCIFASRESPGSLILDGCFFDVPTMVARQAADFGIPEFLVRWFMPGLLFMTGLLYDYDIVNPVDVVADIDCPILFIHEENDVYIRQEEVRRLYQISNNPANEFWEIGGVEHSRSYRNLSEEYIKKVDDFLAANRGL